MNESEERALEHARLALDLAGTTPGEARTVFRPGETEPSYFLVTMGEPDATVAVATIDVPTGELSTSARLPGSGPHLAVDADRARQLAGLVGGRARLVWVASRQTRSPLYPVWEVTGGDRTAYVGVQGDLWPALEPGGPGGA